MIPDVGLSAKFVYKYMRMARQVGEDCNPCYSGRKVGVVIVDPDRNCVIGTGYNGPPRGTEHCDSPEFLRDFVWPQLKGEDFNNLYKNHNICSADDFVSRFGEQKQCPRRILNIESGDRLHLCSCVHGEANSLLNSGQNVRGCIMFCWSCLPCIECSKLIINSGIKGIFCLDGETYHNSSNWLLESGNIIVCKLDADFILGC
jgi:dCMP deaminase